jgi:hypothetical protein
MARLAPESEWLLQQMGGEVVLFHEHTEEEIVRFNPADGNAAAQAQLPIHNSDKLTDEEKSFAHFWSGYFYAHANMKGFTTVIRLDEPAKLDGLFEPYETKFD